MGQIVDISTIEAIVRRASRRLRWQAAFEGATTWAIPAAAAALLVVFLVRAERLDATAGLLLLCATPLIAIAGAVVAALRTESDERVARRVDRASGLSDRLSTALAFQRLLGRGELAEAGDDPAVTRELMKAAIADGINAVPRARIEQATPFQRPRDTRAALGFLVMSALAAGLTLPSSQRVPQLFGAFPDHAAPGAEVVLRGADLLAGASAVAAAGAVPDNASVFLGAGATARPVVVRRWLADQLTVVIPAEAPLGETQLVAYLGKRATAPVRFVVVDARDQRYHKEEAVAVDEQELEYIKALLADIRLTAKQEDAKELDDYAAKVEKLLEQAERGELTKEQLLNEMEKAKSELDKGAEPSEDELAKDLAETGKELAKNPLTKELGKALQKNDLEKAREELEKLAEKLEKNELSKEQQEKLAKQLEKVAEQFEKREQQKDQKAQQQKQELEEQVRRLEKEKREAKNDEEREDAERRLQKKKDELEKLQKDEEERDQSAQREAVKRLHKEMDKAAEQLQKRDKNQDQQDQQQQASRNLKDAARETGRAEQEQRKQTAQKKVASQMEDLKEAMRRAKQKGNKGPQNPFGKDKKQGDFMARARGQQGSRTAWKPGQGQQGKGQGQQGQQGQGQQGQQGQGGQQGQDPGGTNWGTGHDDNLTGEATEKGGHTKDEELQGIQGKGPSRRQTIVAAAQKGFATAKYQEIYADYKRVIEEVMRSEKVPSSYKYYVKRYFNQIKPKN